MRELIKRTPKTALNYEKYAKYEEKYSEAYKRRVAEFNELNTALGYRFHFPNGYGASVVKNIGSYGYEEDLFELAVLDGNALTYDTPITNDVIGWLTNEQVLGLLEQIKNLKREEIQK